MDSTTKQIPEWFEKWAQQEANDKHYCGGDLPDSVIYEAAAANEAWKEGAIAAFRHLSGAGGGMRWIPVDEKNPDKPGRYYTQYKGSFESWLRKDLIYWNGTQWLKGPKEVKFWLYEPEPPTH